MSWPLVKLKDVAEINPRLPKNVDESQIVTFLPMAAVSEQGQILKQEKRILNETRKGFTYFEKNDVVVAKITPCFENGKAAYLGSLETQIGFGTTEFHVIRADIEKLDAKYLFYLVWNKWFRHLGERNMSGSGGQKRVPADFLKELEIPLPPLDEQKRIAAILDKADAIRRKRQQAINLADDFLRSVFLDMFGDPVTNPKGWEVKKIKDFTSVTTGNTPSRKIPEYYGSDLEWIKSDNINTPNHTLTQSTEYLSSEGEKVARTVEKGSILITCIAGSFDCIGNVAFADRKVAFNQQINALTPKYEYVTEWFLYSLILFGKKVIQNASTNSMKGMVSKGKLENVEMILPPLEKQKEFEELFNKQVSIISKMNVSYSNSANNFNSLSQKAFAGEL
ncbi:restriction endonuclease subunit S [Pseudoalteromonas sp. 2CM28B]|uniref:restriction endonuclease subunit S n=1 Tax=Pseudoalteromonas sp. 2CM28B TaxID=2929851 RepID=UPI0020BE85D5|nr:restriction endonuclease subunit S [Pseudoalteromonas sp. 2CM28B]MCK8132218.1 restriction endonuclease subunit S [Pseudoalteromonas sp. 2CM28B]